MSRFRRAGDIRVGVVGYSAAYNMGRHHLQEMAAAGMVPAAVAELSPERREAAAREFPGIGTYESVARMLGESDVHLVAVITPHNTHARLGLEILRAGRHVVLEKPMAVTTAECDALLREARRRRLMVSTYHNRHWDGLVLEGVRRVRSGAIGEVVRVEAHMGQWGNPGDWWRSSRSVSGGALYDWGAHLVEYALQFIDSEMVEVSGFASTGFWASKTRWGQDTNEDEAFAAVRFRGGQWLTLCITSLDSNPKRGVLEVTGTKGSLVLDHRTWEQFTHRGAELVRTSGRNPEGRGACYYRNVADHLVAGARLVITPELGRRVIHVLDLAGRSARLGRAVRTRHG